MCVCEGVDGGTHSGGNGITMKGARGVVRVSHMSRDGKGGGKQGGILCHMFRCRREKTVDGFNYE